MTFVLQLNLKIWGKSVFCCSCKIFSMSFGLFLRFRFHLNLLTTSLSTESGMFLVELQTAWADEWEYITGASLTAIVSLAVWIELWDKSTIIPSRFISSTTVWKKKIRRCCNGRPIARIITYFLRCRKIGALIFKKF